MLKLALQQATIGQPVYAPALPPAGESHQTFGQLAIRQQSATPEGHYTSLSFGTAGLDTIEPALAKARGKTRAELDAIEKAVNEQVTPAKQTRDRYAKDLAGIDAQLGKLGQQIPGMQDQLEQAVVASQHERADQLEQDLYAARARSAALQDRRVTVERLLRDAEAIVARERASTLEARRNELRQRLARDVEQRQEAVAAVLSKPLADLAIAQAALEAFNPPAPEPKPYEKPPVSREEFQRRQDELSKLADQHERLRERGLNPNRDRAYLAG